MSPVTVCPEKRRYISPNISPYIKSSNRRLKDSPGPPDALKGADVTCYGTGRRTLRNFVLALLVSLLGFTDTARSGGDEATVVLPAGSGAETAKGRRLLGLTARCALPAGVTAVAETATETYRFPGLIGMAPDWPETFPLSDQKWVSACVLANLQPLGLEVPVSLRATRKSHVLFKADSAEKETYSLHEGGFFGNLFSDTAVAYACSGTRSPEENEDPVLEGRVCTLRGDPALAVLGLTACGFRLVGACRHIGVPTIAGERYEEVLEVYLKPEAGG